MLQQQQEKPHAGFNFIVGSFSASARTGVVERIPMEIGAGMLVTIDMLQPEGQDLVRPLLQAFADEAGPDAAVQCTVNLR